ncbi:oxidase ustYa family protein [Aspergillus affinis]|uniref:oxidase ustYa family protein n=1 Tax=Aspergillus affinis TaxID=1070780 RepID=UPI0022FE7A01|nr:uncharacterized protein KD926_004372 [Aspergillus affinis]KAI9043189.1 hypothetical protein KD926_004372 [Aspergillus affinis]
MRSLFRNSPSGSEEHDSTEAFLPRDSASVKSNSPMEEAISWTIYDLQDKSTHDEKGRKVPDSQHAIFLPPGPEADAAWADIVKYNNIRISPDEVPEDYRGLPGLVELNDGSGDVYANVAVYHSVHCIKRVHHMLYFEHYHPERSEKQKIDLLQHAEHCLQYLLDAVRCNADLTIFPMQWGVGQRIPFGIDQGRHQCKDWNRIDDWMRSRSVDIYEPGLLMHPKLG